MGIKTISLVTGLVTADVYLQSQLFSSGPLFLLVSNNLIVNILMVALAAVAISVSFKSKFSNWYAYAAFAVAAAVLIVVGLGGVFFGVVVNYFWYVSSPLDYLFLLQYGIIFSLCCLSYAHASKPENVRLSEISAWTSKFKPALPVPKISHSPQSLSRDPVSSTS
ncbi:MAG TPA: hypothetical protein VFW90_01030 [Candidatus Saccharimonadales bacterium]|nr:hypothetical protein [Candidatus Saccharimonadales bacterium]